MPTYFISEHQHKGRPYAEALDANGWSRMEKLTGDMPDLALFDHDVAEGGKGFRKPLDFLHEQGVPVMMYPHAARPMVQWDGIYPVWPHTACQILIAEGHREVCEAYGYGLPMEVCGWAMCEQRPWQSVEVRDRPIEVLFGPIHPNHNGFLHPADRAQNSLTFQKLLETPGIRLTVRHIMRLDLSGIWSAPGVTYKVANPNGKTDEIDQADIVVGHQTFAYLAAARGKPIIMFGDTIVPHSGNTWENFRWAKNYEAYRELMRYPAEMEAVQRGPQLRKLIDLALGVNLGAEWKGKFIGQPMDGKQFVRTVEQYL